MGRRRPLQGPKCPRCDSDETMPLLRFGRPIEGRFQCFACKRRAVGPCWFGPNNPPDAGGTGYPETK